MNDESDDSLHNEQMIYHAWNYISLLDNYSHLQWFEEEKMYLIKTTTVMVIGNLADHVVSLKSMYEPQEFFSKILFYVDTTSKCLFHYQLFF